MAKFRAPSPSRSATSLASTQNDPSKIAQASRPHKLHARPSHHTRTPSISRATAAARNAARNPARNAARNAARIAHMTRPADDSLSVFVGNFHPDVDERELEAYFRRCGKITSINIRCCGGVCTTTKRAPVGYYRARRVRQYAIITFASSEARDNALELAGSVLRGYALAVSRLICDLPEIREKITGYVQRARLRAERPDEHQGEESVLRALNVEPTVLLDPKEQKPHSKRVRRAAIFQHTLQMAVI